MPDAWERALTRGGRLHVRCCAVSLGEPKSSNDMIHPTAVIDPDSTIGPGTRIWHFCHVMSGAVIGRGCTLGQNVFVCAGVRIGDRVTPGRGRSASTVRPAEWAPITSPCGQAQPRGPQPSGYETLRGAAGPWTNAGGTGRARGAPRI